MPSMPLEAVDGKTGDWVGDLVGLVVGAFVGEGVGVAVGAGYPRLAVTYPLPREVAVE